MEGMIFNAQLLLSSSIFRLTSSAWLCVKRWLGPKVKMVRRDSLPEELWRAARMRALEMGIAAQDMVANALAAYLRKGAQRSEPRKAWIADRNAQAPQAARPASRQRREGLPIDWAQHLYRPERPAVLSAKWFIAFRNSGLLCREGAASARAKSRRPCSKSG
jgi:hypothetical protein